MSRRSRTNDKRQPYYDLRMAGTRRMPIEYSPSYIRLKGVLPDRDFSETISATNLLDEAVALGSVEGLEANIVMSNERNWEVELCSNGSRAVGLFSYRCVVSFVFRRC